MCECKKYDTVHPSHRVNNTFHWSFGNSKLAKDGIVSFNIPAFKSDSGLSTCPSASVCALVCYARQGRYHMPRVKKVREHNLAWLRAHSTAEFIDAATRDILALHPAWQRIRIHDSGDFYSQAYMLAWWEIARRCKPIAFYGYTKMISWLAEYRHLMPDNMHFVQSVGGLEDSLIDQQYAHAVIFPTEAALDQAGYVNATKSDEPAFMRQCKIGLVYHGSYNRPHKSLPLITARNTPFLPLPTIN